MEEWLTEFSAEAQRAGLAVNLLGRITPEMHGQIVQDHKSFMFARVEMPQRRGDGSAYLVASYARELQRHTNGDPGIRIYRMRRYAWDGSPYEPAYSEVRELLLRAGGRVAFIRTASNRVISGQDSASYVASALYNDFRAGLFSSFM